MVGRSRHDPDVDRGGPSLRPFFDGYRPAVLDEPLHTFAAQINLAAQYSWRVVPSIDVARVKHYVAAYAERAGTELRRANNRSSR
jgi:hypothetical protein